MITRSFQHFQPTNNSSGTEKAGKGKASGLLSGGGRSFNALFGKVMSQKNNAESAEAVDNFFVQKTIKGGKENSLIDSLMANIQLDGMSPGDVDVDAKGMKLLEQLLESLGFGEKEVADFMLELTDGGEKSTIPLSGLLGKLNSFLKSGDSHDELAMSAIPGIESLLNAMGVDPKNIEKVLYNAGSKNGGLDLQHLIAGLKSISAGDNAGGDLEMNTGNQLLLSGLGLSPSGKKSVSLNEFIEKLEELAKKKNGRVLDGDTVDGIAKSFGESLKPGAAKNRAGGLQNSNNLFGEKNSGEGLQSDTNSFLNNHSFQKQQQAMEENYKLDEVSLKNRESFKSEAGKFIVKDGTILMTEQNSQGGGAGKQDDSGGQSFKMGLTADSMANKTADSVIKLPSERTLPSYVTNQVSMKIANAAKNGSSEFKIQIKPPEMGRLQISLEFTKTGLKVGILAEHTATRDMLLSNSNELKSILADQGIRLEKVQVDVSGNFDQSMADARRESNNSGKREASQHKTENLFDQIAVNETIRLADEASMRSETGRLDLVV